MGLEDRVKKLDWLEALIVSLISGGVWFLADNPGFINYIELPQALTSIQEISLGISVISFLICIYLLYAHSFNTNSTDRPIVENPGAETATSDIQDQIKKIELELRDQREAENGDPPVNFYGELFKLSEDGEVIFTDRTRNASTTRQMLTYLIGNRYAYESGLIENPDATITEIARGCDLAHSTVQRHIEELKKVIEENEVGPRKKYMIRKEMFDMALIEFG